MGVRGGDGCGGGGEDRGMKIKQTLHKTMCKVLCVDNTHTFRIS